MNFKAILQSPAFKTAAHVALAGAAVGLATYDPSQPITSHNVLIPAAASAVTSVISLYSQSPAGASVLEIVKAVLAAKKK